MVVLARWSLQQDPISLKLLGTENMWS